MASVWGQSPTPANPNASMGGGQVGYGLRFTVSTAGTVDGIWFWRASGTSTSADLDVELWNNATDTLLASAQVNMAGAVGQWVYTAFSSPVSVSSGTEYIAAYRETHDFSTQYNGFTADSGLGFPLTVGSITAVKGTRVFSGSAIPDADYDDFYWVDPEFTASSSGVTGTISFTEPGDTVSASGAVGVNGTATVTEPGDTVSASGSVGVNGTVSFTEPADTVAASGTVGSGAVTGSIAITEPGDTVSASGTLRFIGTIAATETADTVSAVGAFLDASLLWSVIREANGTPVDLTTATLVEVRMRPQGYAPPLFTVVCTVVTAASGVVAHAWGEDAVYDGEFVITWADGRVQRLPNYGNT